MASQSSDDGMNRNQLSPKQWKVLEFIEDQISIMGRPPTLRDIAAHCGDAAIGTIQDHVRALVRKGYLQKEEGRARGLKLTHRSESIDIPILGMVPAGHPMEALESSLGSLPIPAKWRGEIYALKVKGESMIDAGILDGDYVIVKKQTHAENGQIVVALIDGEATVKTLEKKQGRVRLLPANPKFHPIEMNAEGENLIHGIVVSVHRYY